MNEEKIRKCPSEILFHEINSLKTIISVMRKELESAAESTSSKGDENSCLQSNSILEQQLTQCRSYLDLLLMPREILSNHVHGVGGDECSIKSDIEQLMSCEKRIAGKCKSTCVNVTK